MKRRAVKKEPKYVTERTFEKSMRNISKSFERHEEVLQNILKEIKAIHEDHRDFRLNIANIYADNLPRDRKIENLTARVEKLELKAR